MKLLATQASILSTSPKTCHCELHLPNDSVQYDHLLPLKLCCMKKSMFQAEIGSSISLFYSSLTDKFGIKIFSSGNKGEDDNYILMTLYYSLLNTTTHRLQHHLNISILRESSRSWTLWCMIYIRGFYKVWHWRPLSDKIKALCSVFQICPRWRELT